MNRPAGCACFFVALQEWGAKTRKRWREVSHLPVNKQQSGVS
jgi:hypothetical protein